MTVTLTASYKEFLSTDAVEKVEELLEENYALEDMLEFIDTYNENDFVAYYEEYVRCGEAIGYEAVDALIEKWATCPTSSAAMSVSVVSTKALQISLKSSPPMCMVTFPLTL